MRLNLFFVACSVANYFFSWLWFNSFKLWLALSYSSNVAAPLLWVAFYFIQHFGLVVMADWQVVCSEEEGKLRYADPSRDQSPHSAVHLTFTSPYLPFSHIRTTRNLKSMRRAHAHQSLTFYSTNAHTLLSWWMNDANHICFYICWLSLW